MRYVKKYKKNCLFCKKKFVCKTNYKKQKFCSYGCYHAYRRKHTGEFFGGFIKGRKYICKDPVARAHKISKTMKTKGFKNISLKCRWNMNDERYKLYLERKIKSQKETLKNPEVKLKIRQARAKQKFPFNDTSCELLIDKILKELNVKYEKQKYELEGTPDRFIKPNVCLFADGDYWHANPKFHKSTDIIAKSYTAQDKWNRDFKITKTLESQGYKVLRFWQNDLINDMNYCKNIISEVIHDI